MFYALKNKIKIQTRQLPLANIQFTENKLINLYIKIDGLLLAYKNYLLEKGLLTSEHRTRVPYFNDFVKMV